MIQTDNFFNQVFNFVNQLDCNIGKVSLNAAKSSYTYHLKIENDGKIGSIVGAFIRTIQNDIRIYMIQEIEDELDTNKKPFSLIVFASSFN